MEQSIANVEGSGKAPGLPAGMRVRLGSGTDTGHVHGHPAPRRTLQDGMRSAASALVRARRTRTPVSLVWTITSLPSGVRTPSTCTTG